MYDQHLWVAEYAHFLFHGVDSFTLAALVTTLSHSLWLNESIETLFQLHIACNLDSLARNTDRQV